MKNISDEKLRAYFLGKLSEEESENLEIECALQAELTARAQTVEGDLTDDYLRGNLSAPEVELFEKNYLITEARRKKLHVAKGLWKIANELTPIRPAINASSNSFWQTIFGRRKAFQLAFGGFILLLVFGTLVFYLLTLKVDKTDVAEVKDANQTAKIETPVIQNPDNQEIKNPATEIQNPKTVSTNLGIQNKEAEKDSNSPQKNQPETKTPSTPKNVEPSKSALVLVVKLLPGSLRDDGEQFVTVTASVKSLHLLLSPAGEPNNYKIYRALVKTPEGETIFTSPNLKALSFTLSADKLENRTYIIFLEGKNPQSGFESIAEYTFRVRR